jgi:hypothetical protein
VGTTIEGPRDTRPLLNCRPFFPEVIVAKYLRINFGCTGNINKTVSAKTGRWFSRCREIETQAGHGLRLSPSGRSFWIGLEGTGR